MRLPVRLLAGAGVVAAVACGVFLAFAAPAQLRVRRIIGDLASGDAERWQRGLEELKRAEPGLLRLQSGAIFRAFAQAPTPYDLYQVERFLHERATTDAGFVSTGLADPRLSEAAYIALVCAGRTDLACPDPRVATLTVVTALDAYPEHLSFVRGRPARRWPETGELCFTGTEFATRGRNDP